jgi:hypothetical protein
MQDIPHKCPFHGVVMADNSRVVSTRNPKYNAAIRNYHLLRKAFQTLGQHLWMQPTAAMKRLAHQSLAATVLRSTSDLGFNPRKWIPSLGCLDFPAKSYTTIRKTTKPPPSSPPCAPCDRNIAIQPHTDLARYRIAEANDIMIPYGVA